MGTPVYPLIFEPILKPRIWGGRRLATRLGKSLPEGERIGESWEVADLENAQSVVAAGPEKGKTLDGLVNSWGERLTGRAKLVDGRFPLLIKFLDADGILSVQVHPDQAAARRMGGTVRVKHEAWYVIEALPGAFLYHGLCEGVDADQLRQAVIEGRVESVLRKIPARRGHCYDLPSGTVHALGGGLLVAEVQTPSDTTYRLYDWGRSDPATGRPRELHLADALPCVRFAPTAPEQLPQHTASVWTTMTSLCRSESFVIERVRMVEGVEMEIPHAEMVIWIVLEGRGTIVCEGGAEAVEFAVGQTVVLPAALKKGRVRTSENAMWLEVTVPVESSLADFARPDRASLTASPVAERYVPLRLPPKPNPE